MKKFCRAIYKKLFPPIPITEDENISRLIFSSRHLKNGMIKPAAFLPNPKDNKTSVFRKSLMTSEEYKQIKLMVSKLRQQRLKGAGVILAGDITSSSVDLQPEESEFKWHADIVSWPESKEEQKSIAQELANKCKAEI